MLGLKLNHVSKNGPRYWIEEEPLHRNINVLTSFRASNAGRSVYENDKIKGAIHCESNMIPFQYNIYYMRELFNSLAIGTENRKPLHH